MGVSANTSQENIRGDHIIHGESSELPMIDFDKILVATDNFNRLNKLGEGGFGPVYKVITLFFSSTWYIY